MKKYLMLALSLVVVSCSCLTVNAAPVKMSDGNYFDAAYYAQNNQDVVAALGNDVSVLYNHYQTSGKAEGRLPYSPDTVLPITTGSYTLYLKTALPKEYTLFPNQTVFKINSIDFSSDYVGNPIECLYMRFDYAPVISSSFPYDAMWVDVNFLDANNKIIFSQMVQLVNYDTYVLSSVYSSSLPVGTYFIEIRTHRI